jgi:hypothetical protein
LGQDPRAEQELPDPSGQAPREEQELPDLSERDRRERRGQWGRRDPLDLSGRDRQASPGLTVQQALPVLPGLRGWTVLQVPPVLRG